MKITRREMLQISTMAAAATRTAWAQTDPIATTNSGKVRGSIDNGINVFKGIPYGKNTALTRFQPPIKPQPWKGGSP